VSRWIAVTITNRIGEDRLVKAKEDPTLMEVIREHGFSELQALCGGCCSCATCHVYVDPSFSGRLSQMGADEDALLDGSSHRAKNSRLSCQIRIAPSLDGLRVTIAPED
jgi:ferredoxin, 2Fe-2S